MKIDISHTLMPIEPTQKEEDCLRTKCIAILKDEASLCQSIEALIRMVHSTPIDAEQSTSVVTLMQRLTTKPGKTIIVKGAFKRHPGGLSTPISGSFEVSTEV